MKLISEIRSRTSQPSIFSLISTVFWRQKPKVLVEICNNFLQDKLAKDDEKIGSPAHMRFYEYLSLLPFLAGTEVKTIKIQDQIYDICPISLMDPKRYPCPSSQYHAYGLSPSNSSEGAEEGRQKPLPSYLIFMGTTYPGSPGFWQTILADMAPWRNVGDWFITEYAKTELTKWLSKQENVTVTGISLGGALAGTLGLDLASHDKKTPIRQIIQIKPPGLFYRVAEERRKIEKFRDQDRTKMITYIVHDDPVGRLGAFSNPEVHVAGRPKNASMLNLHADVVTTDETKIIATPVNQVYSDAATWRLNRVVEPILRTLGLPIFLTIWLYECIKNQVYGLFTTATSKASDRAFSPFRCALSFGFLLGLMSYILLPWYLPGLTLYPAVAITAVLGTGIIYGLLRLFPEFFFSVASCIAPIIALLVFIPCATMASIYTMIASIVSLCLYPFSACYTLMFSTQHAMSSAALVKKADEEKQPGRNSKRVDLNESFENKSVHPQ